MDLVSLCVCVRVCVRACVQHGGNRCGHEFCSPACSPVSYVFPLVCTIPGWLETPTGSPVLLWEMYCSMGQTFPAIFSHISLWRLMELASHGSPALDSPSALLISHLNRGSFWDVALSGP
jgi:hypothetical protein